MQNSLTANSIYSRKQSSPVRTVTSTVQPVKSLYRQRFITSIRQAYLFVTASQPGQRCSWVRKVVDRYKMWDVTEHLPLFKTTNNGRIPWPTEEEVIAKNRVATAGPAISTLISWFFSFKENRYSATRWSKVRNEFHTEICLEIAMVICWQITGGMTSCSHDISSWNGTPHWKGFIDSWVKSTRHASTSTTAPGTIYRYQKHAHA